jgi:hypothetical protein
MGVLSRLASAASVAVILAGAAPAAAYCRSTTCAGADCPRDADGCKTTGEKLAWPGVCVGFSLQRDGTAHIPIDDVQAVVAASFAAWSDVDCGGAAPSFASIAFSELDRVSCHASEFSEGGPNANVLLFQDTLWRFKGEGDTLAKTTVTFDADTGEILDADIELNHAYNEFTIADDVVVYDLQSIVTHEIGHFLGLDHTPEGEATMNAAYHEGSIAQRTLEPDDVAAVCEAYPPGRGGACDPEPRNGLGDACAEGGGSGDAGGCAVAASRPRAAVSPAWLLGLGLLPLAAMRRVHRRKRCG